jgi:hypothetical protein
MGVTYTNDLPTVEGQVAALLAQAVGAAAEAVHAGVLERMADGKSGRFYSHPAPHVAAAPGEAPAIVTGDLAGSYVADVEGLHAEVGSDSLIAVYQELGTRNMPAHPALLPATADGVAAAQTVLDAGGA